VRFHFHDTKGYDNPLTAAGVSENKAKKIVSAAGFAALKILLQQQQKQNEQL